MKRAFILIITLSALLLLFVFGLFQFSGNAIVVPQKVSSDQIIISWAYCEDSDFNNIFNFGNVSAGKNINRFWKIFGTRVKEYVFEDRCVNNTIYEFYCLNVSDSVSVPRVNPTICKDGCENGACIFLVQELNNQLDFNNSSL